MVFSSHIFIFYFLALILGVYYFSPHRLRHLVLTLGSYFFYAWWNPWFVLLMITSTIIDFTCGKVIYGSGSKTHYRKLGLLISIIANLSILGFFKYGNFFVDNISVLALSVGLGEIPLPNFFREIILPIGISFYTFQSMSYTIDIYRKHAKPATDFLSFACYVSMFPQLVAGPIVRYSDIANQLKERIHSTGTFVYGFSRFNYGFAKKILLANPVGEVADLCFSAGELSLSTPASWIGICFYSFQIYFDFSAYSDMAIGLGRMFGFRFNENFNSPYKSKSITEFWRRWHISLSSFLRDYLYVPLGGNRKGSSRTYFNLILVMFLGGLWHGAQWTFIAWGIIHGSFLVIERLFRNSSLFRNVPNLIKVSFTFTIVVLAWVFFRAENFDRAFIYLSSMFGAGDSSQSSAILLSQVTRPMVWLMAVISIIFIFAIPNSGQFLKKLTKTKVSIGLLLLVLSVSFMFAQDFNPFLYFQF